MTDIAQQLLDPDGVFSGLQPYFSSRKARLFAVACCRLLEQWMTEPCCHWAVERSEQFADGEISKQVLAVTRKEFSSAERTRLRRGFEGRGHAAHFDELPDGDRPFVWAGTYDACHSSLRADAWDAARLCQVAAKNTLSQVPDGHENLGHLQRALKDVFGDSLRPSAFDSRWRTEDTVGLSRGIYEDLAFDRLPLLADALMDAGCADEQVLGHCRSDGPHVRGCWVVDLVLNKE
jgi:hypothetical protein